VKLNFNFKISQALFWLHLALGVLAGLVVLVLSATGAVLVLQRPITSLVDRDVRRLSSSEQARLASAGAVVLAWTGLALTWRRFRAWAGRRATAPAAGTLGPDAPEALGDNA
jgi:uncharacterized iron-regulated membrane protein